MKRLFFSLLAGVALLSTLLFAQPPRQLTPEQQAQLQAQQAATREDHQRMMKLLGLAELRQGTIVST